MLLSSILDSYISQIERLKIAQNKALTNVRYGDKQTFLSLKLSRPRNCRQALHLKARAANQCAVHILCA